MNSVEAIANLILDSDEETDEDLDSYDSYEDSSAGSSHSADSADSVASTAGGRGGGQPRGRRWWNQNQNNGSNNTISGSSGSSGFIEHTPSSGTGTLSSGSSLSASPSPPQTIHVVLPRIQRRQQHQKRHVHVSDSGDSGADGDENIINDGENFEAQDDVFVDDTFSNDGQWIPPANAAGGPLYGARAHQPHPEDGGFHVADNEVPWGDQGGYVEDGGGGWMQQGPSPATAYPTMNGVAAYGGIAAVQPFPQGGAADMYPPASFQPQQRLSQRHNYGTAPYQDMYSPHQGWQQQQQQQQPFYPQQEEYLGAAAETGQMQNQDSIGVDEEPPTSPLSSSPSTVNSTGGLSRKGSSHSMFSNRSTRSTASASVVRNGVKKSNIVPYSGGLGLEEAIGVNARSSGSRQAPASRPPNTRSGGGARRPHTTNSTRSGGGGGGRRNMSVRERNLQKLRENNRMYSTIDDSVSRSSSRSNNSRGGRYRHASVDFDMDDDDDADYDYHPEDDDGDDDGGFDPAYTAPEDRNTEQWYSSVPRGFHSPYGRMGAEETRKERERRLERQWREKQRQLKQDKKNGKLPPTGRR